MSQETGSRYSGWCKDCTAANKSVGFSQADLIWALLNNRLIFDIDVIFDNVIRLLLFCCNWREENIYDGTSHKILTIFATDETNILNILNIRWPTIKFRSDREKNGKLPFLDVEIIRTAEKLEFAVYRKPGYIPADSYCPQQHKTAAHGLSPLQIAAQRKQLYEGIEIY